MKKIVYIGNKLSKKGKTQTAIETLGNHLVQEGFQVVSASDKANKLIRLLDMIYTVIKNAKSTNYVLIDTYSTSNFYYAYIISRLCRLLKIKYIPILRGGDLPSRLESSNAMSNIIFGNAENNIAPSKYLQEAFNAHGYDNVICIPNTIEIKNYEYHEKTYDSAKLLWVRSFSSIYNPEMALHVFKKLNDDGIVCKLCMVGPEVDGSLKRVKELASELELDVDFTGKLKKEEWIALSKDYNLFINTTDFDNTPVSVMEAMALGLPVISTNVGGLPYLIEDNHDGCLISPNDVSAMVEKVKYLLNNEEKAIKISKAARLKAESFDWQDVKEKWVKLLN